MNSKKLASIIIVVASVLLIALIMQSFGDKKYERRKYAKPIVEEKKLSSEEMKALEDELYEAQLNAQWQTSTLATLRGEPSPERVSLQEKQVVKTQTGLKKALNDAYEVAKDVIKKSEITFVQAQKEIIAKRKEIDLIISKWKDAIVAGNPPSPAVVHGYLDSINQYLGDIDQILDRLTPDNSTLTQKQIDEYKNTIESSISEVNNAVSNLDQAQEQVKSAEEALHVEQSVGNTDAINNQTQKVLEAQAQVALIEEKIKEAEPAPPTPTVSPIYIDIPENDYWDPNIKIIPLEDPNKPHLLQD